MKWLIVAFILLSGCSGCAHAEPSAMLTRLAPSTVQIEDSEGFGSGVVVGPELVLTCAHVVWSKARGLTVRVDLIEKDYPAYILSMDVAHDIALLRVPGLKARAIRVATADPPRFSQVWSLAAPLGVKGVATPEIVTRLDDEKGFRWMLSGAVSHGASGGAVVDARGDLLCLTETTAMEQGGLMGACVNRATIVRFLALAGTPAKP
jgi:serine protease Do